MKKNDKIKKMFNNHGFTLLEAVISISILAVGILAIVALQTSSIQRNSHAKGITSASSFATDEMEYRMALNYQHAYLQDDSAVDDYIIDENCCPNHPAVVAGYTINTDIRDTAYLQKEISVNVSWSNFGSMGEAKSLTFENIKARLRDR